MFNYRLVHAIGLKENYYTITEVYYDEHNNINYFCASGIGILNETIEECKIELERFQIAMEKPIVVATEFEKGRWRFEEI